MEINTDQQGQCSRSKAMQVDEAKTPQINRARSERHSVVASESDEHILLRMTTADAETANSVKNEILQLCLDRKLNALVALAATRCAAECFEEMINEKGGEVVEFSCAKR